MNFNRLFKPIKVCMLLNYISFSMSSMSPSLNHSKEYIHETRFKLNL